MINAVNPFGHSFAGLTAYLTHDQDKAHTSDRVAWTHTHNLATDDPEKAWRIMAATAMSQADLKAEAGIKNTGRKSNAHVLHYVISWSPDEYGEYSKEDMLDAAMASMSYIGLTKGERIGKGKYAKRTQYASEHQALIVCHDEGPGKNPHVHIMVNRVHPEHGVMVSDSKDYEKLSAWALDYRRAQGKEHLCPEREKNAAKRAKGVLTSHPRKPDNVYWQEKAINDADPASRKKALLEWQARKGKELKAKTEAMKRRHTEAMHALETRQLDAERSVRVKSAEKIRAKTARIRASYAPKIDALADRQLAEKRAFHKAKQTAAGHVGNTWQAFKTKDWMAEIRTKKLHAVTGAFKLAFSSGMQEQQLDNYHKHERGQLNGQKKAREAEATREIRMDEGLRLDSLRQKYHEQRNDLLLTQGMDQAKNNAEWNQHARDGQAIQAEDLRGRVPANDNVLRRNEQQAIGTGGSGSPINTRPKSGEVPDVAVDFDQATVKPEDDPGDDDDKQRRIDAKIEMLKQAREQKQKRGLGRRL